ncbi:MAG: cyclomaltodextrinase N-terminal domain-containing protein, partial [Chitinophagaceae bacterium]|nr:cyclomaltodextrinase N-terminal domain-containing protein [Chitinophagaceae bacterium]
MRSKFLILSCFLSLAGIAQYAKVYPSNWFTAMKWNRVQLLIRSEAANFSGAKLRINYPGIKLLQQQHLPNPHYLVADIEIGASAKPGTVELAFVNGDALSRVSWQLKAHRTGSGSSYAQGVTSADFIYFLMPDRFSNGDEGNDRVAGMRDQSLNRDSIFLRHGGDLQGVTDHLDYLQQLGVTTLWMTPVIENDMPNRTEHGYAFTDHYRIEPRFGGEAAYKKLSDELHRRGMKLIQDAVYNHVGRYH